MPHTTTSNHSETSVLFNLQELMRIETERVQADVAAQRAAHDALIRQQRDRQRLATEADEREQRRQREHAQQVAAAQAAADAERATALLGVRLKLEAAEHAERLRRQREHLRAMELIAAQTRGASTWKQVSAMLGVTAALIAGGYFALVAPMLETIRAREAEAVALAVAHARELAALRDQTATPTVVVPELPNETPPTLESSVGPSVVKTKRTRTAPVEPERQVVRESALDEFDDDNDDPLIGLGQLKLLP